MKVWIMFAGLLVIWITIVGPPRMHQSIYIKDVNITKNLSVNFRTIRFTTVGFTPETYSSFLEEFRTALRSANEREGIAVLPDPDTLTQLQDQYILLELSNDDSEWVTLVFSVSRIYLWGYRVGQYSYFVTGAPESARQVFPDTTPDDLSFTSNYNSILNIAGQSRENIRLGPAQLNEAITYLIYTPDRTTDTNQAYAFYVVCQMIAEATRFRSVENLVRNNYRHQDDPLETPLFIFSLQNNWRALSRAIQNTGLWTDVRIERSYNDYLTLTGVTQPIINIVALIFFQCQQQSYPNHLYGLPFPSFLGDAPAFLSMFNKRSLSDTKICDDPEIPKRIMGRDGLCVDVSSGKYNDGNAIILWPCSSNIETVNQLWTFKVDGTIRSNNKCLTTYGYSPGVYVMIYDCVLAVTDATRWQLLDEGTILNPKSGLVLTATGSQGTTLTVETDIQASRQGWQAINISDPFVESIVGFQELCLEANGNAVWMAECETNKGQKQWGLYPDGTIRPWQNTNNCITSNGVLTGDKVVIQSCSSASTYQRWMFKNDGTIMQLNSGLVMDVKGSDPSLKEIIIWSPTGKPNQLWFVSLI